MKRLRYDHSEYLVGDDVADALLEYTVILARRDSADTVEVETLKPDGTPERVTFVIGTATMMTAAVAETSYADPDNTVVVRHLKERIETLQRPVRTLTERDDSPQIDDWG